MLRHRLQVLLDDERHARITAEAKRRQVPIAVVVRDAIDSAVPSDLAGRRAALESILAAEPMSVPETVEELKAEIAEMHDRHGW